MATLAAAIRSMRDLGAQLQPVGISCMLVFGEGGKPDSPEKNPRSREENQHKLNPLMASGPGIEPRPQVGGKHSHHYTIPASLIHIQPIKSDFLRVSRIGRHSRKIDFSFISPKHTFRCTYSRKNSFNFQRFILRPKFKKVRNLHIMAVSAA